MQMRLELTGIQMPPDPLLGMVTTAQLAPTLRTALQRSRLMFHPDVHPLTRYIQVNTLHSPRLLQSQYLSVQIGVSHEGFLLENPSYIISLPTAIPEGPLFSTT
jgi:hypothetical protein